MSDRFSLIGDAAVVTGAARGLGKAIATAFAEEGAKVVLADISPDVETVARSLRDGGATAFGLVTDVTRASDCEALAQFAAEKLGHIDMLVCNAGIDIPGPALTLDRRCVGPRCRRQSEGLFPVRASGGPAHGRSAAQAAPW